MDTAHVASNGGKPLPPEVSGCPGSVKPSLLCKTGSFLRGAAQKAWACIQDPAPGRTCDLPGGPGGSEPLL